MSFWSNLAEEFSARRKRLHRGPLKGVAAPIEFAILGGVVLAAASPLVARNGLADVPWGPVLPVVVALGYVLVERRRQRALTLGEDAEALTPAYDKRANWLLVAVAAAGIATFAWALLKPPPQTFIPDEPPASATFEVDIGP